MPDRDYDMTDKEKQARGWHPCADGCGELVPPGKRFVPGHDGKLRSQLLKTIYYSDDKQKVKQARDKMKEIGWEHLIREDKVHTQTVNH